MTVEVVHGVEPGPVVWLSGAVHGDEIVGVEIIRQVLDLLDPRRLAGTVLAVPIVNVFGFVTGSRYLPDRRDLNRVFPGSERGSLASRLARTFMDRVVEPAAYGIDFHAGSDDRTNLPQIRGNLEDGETRRLAEVFAAPVMMHSETIRGSLREAAGRLGKRVLLFEGGEPRRFSRFAVEMAVPGTLRVLHALGMIPVEVVRAPARPSVECVKSHWVRAPRGGVFRMETHLGAVVAKGEPLGVVTDPVAPGGRAVRSPCDGIVIGHAVNPLVHQGNGLVHVGVVVE
ncbi:MAG: deacylase [Gemmatimonadetes bacterium]|nr:MAG: deacylase [Gemmatimonadota bacterium]